MGQDVFSKFEEKCEQWNQEVFLYEARADSYRSMTYKEALLEVKKLSSFLSTLALPKGTKAAILSENCCEWFIAFLAALSQGWVVVPLDTKFSAKEWSYFLNHSETNVLFCSQKFSNSAKELLEKVPTLKFTLGWGESLPSDIYSIKKATGEVKASPGHFTDRPGPEDPACLIYTSGTTGHPKGILLSHANLLKTAPLMQLSVDRAQFIVSVIIPLHHIFCLTGMIAKFLLGHQVILYPVLDQKLLFESFEQLKPHAFIGVPGFYERFGQMLKEQIDRKIPRFLSEKLFSWGGLQPTRFQSLKKVLFRKVHQKLGGRMKYLVSGGAPLDHHLGQIFNLVGLPLLEGYGLTETSSIVSAQDLPKDSYRIRSVGRPSSEIKIKVDRPDQEGIGEICIQGPGIMSGYYKDEAATREVIDSEGWCHTGDLGTVDQNGFLFITGRIKEVIVTANGKKINAHDLEHFFKHLSFVKELCVFGIPSQSGSRGEKVHLQVYPDYEGLRQNGIENLEAFFKKVILKKSEELADFQRPQSIGFSKSPFPRTTTLKIKRFQLRKDYLKNQQEGKKETSTPQTMDPVFKTPSGDSVYCILKRILPPGVLFDPRSSFGYDLGLDSLKLMEFWALIEEAFQTKIPEDQRGKLNAVGDALSYLQSLPFSLSPSASGVTSLKNSDPWRQILQEEDPHLRNVAESILSSFSHRRPFFLKIFRKSFEALSHLKGVGLERLPREGPYILAPNHECYLDNLFVASLLSRAQQRDMAVIGAKEFFDQFFTRTMAKMCHTIPLERGQPSSRALQIGLETLKMKKILLIHPEGTRSPNGEFLPLKPGVALLACFSQCPVVPIYIEGGHEFWPKGSQFPKSRSQITVTFGHPLDPMAPQENPLLPLIEMAQELLGRLEWSWLALKEERENTQWVKARSRPLTSEIHRPSFPRENDSSPAEWKMEESLLKNLSIKDTLPP